MLKIYNSLTKQKEEFRPLREGEVSLYVCGNTVYDYCHMGHARTHVAFDVIVRHFKVRNFKVNYIRNITDIDDKIINRANENNEAFNLLTKRMIKAQNEDYKALNLLPPNGEPKASDNIAEIISLVESLIDKDYAYVGSNGDVFFQVEKFKPYGKLSKKDLNGQISGARVDIVKEKKAPLDFVLWKKAKSDEPSWPSPWGEGRPGWHIECSAMSMASLGESFDIHGGGFDLQFPHHENEIAQSEAATGKPFANYWMHVGFLQINEEKMSKSLGNFFTIKDVLKRYSPEVVRFFLVSSHYRSQLNFSDETLNNAKAALTRLYQSLELSKINEDTEIDTKSPWLEKFNNAMDDDFNTPKALAVLFELSREINRLDAKGEHKALKPLGATLKQLSLQLGILEGNLELLSHQLHGEINESEIQALINERYEARKNQQWQRADEIRSLLEKKGIALLDGAEGTTWRTK